MPINYFYLFTVFMLSLICASPLPALETKTGQTPEDMKSRTFTHIAATASALKTIIGDFSQEKHLAMLKDPLVSSGRFVYEKPDRLYWEILKPSPAGFAVSGSQARRWGSNPGAAETFAIDQEPVIKGVVEQLFAWSRADFLWLEKRYRITVMEEIPSKLKLIPLSPQEKRILTHLIIDFSRDWTHVRSVEIHEKGGDFTRLLFFNTLLNPSLPKDFFGKQ